MLTKEKIKEFASWIDEKIDWKKITGKEIFGSILETADNWIIPEMLKYIDSFGDKLPVKFHDNINDIVDACIMEDVQLALNTLPNLQQDLANIKALDDSLESAWVTINIAAIIQFVEYYFKK